MSTSDPGCCGDAATMVTVIIRATGALLEGHLGLARMYESLAAKSDVPEKDRASFAAMAMKHQEIADTLREIVVPEQREEGG